MSFKLAEPVTTDDVGLTPKDAEGNVLRWLGSQAGAFSLGNRILAVTFKSDGIHPVGNTSHALLTTQIPGDHYDIPNFFSSSASFSKKQDERMIQCTSYRKLGFDSERDVSEFQENKKPKK